MSTTIEIAFKRATRALGVSFLAMALLVATNLGEFWPFSIFPMFSSAGKSWSRAIVQKVPETDDGTELWTSFSYQDLPGETLALAPRGLHQNDLSNMISKTSVWDANRRAALQDMFDQLVPNDSILVIYKVTGRKENSGEVSISARPIAVQTKDALTVNPDLSPE